MNTLLLSYELSLLAKAKGFDLPCLFGYGGYTPKDKWDNELLSANAIAGSLIDWNSANTPSGRISAPLYQQMIEWLQTKKIFIWLEPTGSWKYSVHFRYEDAAGKHWLYKLIDDNSRTRYFEDINLAYNEGIEKAFKIIK